MKKLMMRLVPLCAMLFALFIPAPVSAKTANATATPTISGASYSTTVKIHLSDIPADGNAKASEAAKFSSRYVSLSSTGYSDYLRVKFTLQNGAQTESVVATVTKSGVATTVTLPLYDTSSAGLLTYRAKVDGTITQIDINLKHVCAYDYKQVPATTTKATCTEDGMLTRTCIYCKGTDTQINEKATGHTFTKKNVDAKYLKAEATCTEDAVYYYSCCVCGEVGTETFTEKDTATGHQWDEGKITKEATEEEPGVKTFTCTTCKETRTEEIPVLEHTHTFTLKVAEDKYLAKAATCTSAAVYYTSCRCGEAGTETFESGDPLPHSFTKYVSDNNATCTEDGMKTAVCDLCGVAKNTVKDAGSAKGHAWDEGVVTKEATEEEPGVKTFTCTTCNATHTEEIPVLAHTHSFTLKVTEDKYLAKVATCTSAVVYYTSCRCGEAGTETFESGDPLPHSFTKYVSDNNATCTEDGMKTAVCDLCGVAKNTVKDAGSAKGHAWDEGVVTKEATEEEPGVKTFTCTVCSATYNAEIPVLEHTHAFTQKVAEDTYLVKTATCTSAAVYHTSCRCGEAGTETFESGDPLPHSFTNYVSDNNATCTEDGTKTATCDLCGEAKNTVRDTGSVKSHTWDEGVVTKEATADSEGEKTFTCQTCQATKTEVIPKKEQAPADPSKDNTKTAADNPSPTPTAEPEVIKPEITDTPSPTPTITNTSTPTPEATSTQSPKTGDDNTWMLWTVLLMFSGIGLVSTGMIRRRRNG